MAVPRPPIDREIILCVYYYSRKTTKGVGDQLFGYIVLFYHMHENVC